MTLDWRALHEMAQANKAEEWAGWYAEMREYFRSVLNCECNRDSAKVGWGCHRCGWVTVWRA